MAKQPQIIIQPMHEGAHLDWRLPDWVKIAMSDCIVLFGRMEQEIVEVVWLLKEADVAARVKIAREPASKNFEFLIGELKKASGETFDTLSDGFDKLARERNLMAHGAWWIVDGTRPWVVWHKFIEDDGSVIGEYFEKHRFEHFMTKTQVIYDTCRMFHGMLEEGLGVTTSGLNKLK
jgi:hypothetical protein